MQPGILICVCQINTQNYLEILMSASRAIGTHTVLWAKAMTMVVVSSSF